MTDRPAGADGSSVGIIGTGWVGTSVAISTLHAAVAGELLLYDVRQDLAEGEAMDLSHGSSFYPRAEVKSVALDEMSRTQAVVIAAGRGGVAGQSRLELARENARIVESLANRFTEYRGIVVMVTNPVDLMTQVFQRVSGLAPEQVIGTGTMLDTARLRQALGREFDMDPRSIHAQVVGEHGDSEVCLWSGAMVGGTRLRHLSGWSPQREEAIAGEVRQAAYRIIEKKGATNHAIGLVAANLLRGMLRNDRRVLTVSRLQTGALGITDVALSLPTVVGSTGADQVLEPETDPEERQALDRSAEVLRRALAEIV